MSEQIIEVEKREATGSAASRRLRRDGQVPAVVYGGGMDSVSVTVNRKKLVTLLNAGGSDNTIFVLTMGEQRRHALIRDMQVHPITGQLDHVDFQRILLSEKVRVTVHVELTGTAVGVKLENGIVDFVTRALEVECLPAEIPEELKVDVTSLHVGQHLEAKDVPLPANVTLVDSPDKVIVSVAGAKLAAEGEGGGEGLLEGGKAEPEVQARHKEKG